ncbi:MAG: tetratricopeptide repeat protein, partial [Cyanobacteria bacterium J06558_2]
MLLLLVLSGCNRSENNLTVDNKSEVSDVSLNNDNSLTIFGVSKGDYKNEIELRIEAEKQAEEAKKQVEQIIRDGNLDETEKRILEGIEFAQRKGDKKLALELIEEIEEYRLIKKDETDKQLAEVLVLKGRELFALLQVEAAQQELERAVELDSNNPEYLITLGDYFHWNGKYQEMEEVSLKAVALINKQKPIDKILLANSLNNLGRAYLFGGKYDLAVEPFKQALEIGKKQLGEEHPSVAIRLNNLAALYESQGRYSEAEPL